MSVTKHLTRVDEAEQIELSPGEYMTILQEGDATHPDVIDAIIPPYASPPRHHHPWATYELVVEGQLRAEVDGVTYELGPGDFLLTPAGAVHSFINPGPEAARVIGMNVPGAAEFYRGLAAAMTPDGPDLEKVQTLAEANGAAVVGPPMSLE